MDAHDVETLMKNIATKDDVREDGERTRRHIDAFAEQIRQQLALIIEEQKACLAILDNKCD
jgi:hypothetical protein